jgi:hypothetical protein
MSILIKGMDMPTSCWDCYFQDCGNCRLNADKVVDKCIIEDRRDDDCPLVPVPPHGRLIEEVDAIETAWMILRGLGYLKEENPQLEQTVREVFATAPAIEVE